MATQKELQALVQRRLQELAIMPEEASRRADGAVAPQAIADLAAGRAPSHISDRFALALAVALSMPEVRVRRAAGLPRLSDPREAIDTVPHLRLIDGAN